MSLLSASRPSARRSTSASLRMLGACAAVALAAPTARAQSPFTLNFNGIALTNPSGVQSVPNCYTESGIRVTVVGEACGLPAMGMAPALAAFTPAAATGYTGSPALFNNLGFSVDFTTVGGLPFSLTSIDLAPIFLIGSPAMSVTFTGMRTGMANVSQTCNLAAGLNMLSRCNFTGFTNLASVRMTPSAPDFSVQFDNVTGSVVPEPGTVLLVGAGLLGAAGLARRRRSVS